MTRVDRLIGAVATTPKHGQLLHHILHILIVAGLVGVASLMALALLGALVRYIPRHPKPIELPDVGRNAAMGLVQDLIWAASDFRFGFPTGFFAVDIPKSGPDRIIGREQIFWKTNTQSLLLAAFRGPANWGHRNDTMAGEFLGVAILILLLPILLWVTAADMMMRWLLRSQIVVRLSDLEDRFGTVVHITLWGPSARFAAPRLIGAFATPKLPNKVANAAKGRSLKEMTNV